MKALALIALSLALTACSLPLLQPPPTPDYATLVVTLERMACFGSCPIYKLTIYGDGAVVYEGEDFVQVTGKQTATISAEKVRELVAEIQRARFFGLQDSYSAPATDLPSAITSVTLNGQSKSINHYGSCGFDFDTAPPELCAIENKIDEITNSAQWVGR